MKKLVVLSIVLLFAVASIFAQGASELVRSGNIPADPAAPAVEEAPAVVEKAPIEGMKKLIVLNNAFEGLEKSSQVYNAKAYYNAFSLGEIVDANFWIVPADDANADTVAFTDFYTDTTTVKDFKAKFVSLVKDNMDFDYDIFVGQKQKETYDVKYKGFCKLGAEALVFVPEDGWAMAELQEYLPFAEAETYDMVTVGGDVYRITAEELADFELLMEDGVVVVSNGDITVADPLYFIPTGFTAESEVQEGKVMRATVINDAIGVYGCEPAYSENRAGTVYSAWSVADLLAKFDVPVAGDVVITSYKDGYTDTISAEAFAARYIAFQAPTAKGDQKDYFTLGKAQARNAGVNNVGSYVLADASFVYISEAGLNVAECAAATGMTASDCYEVTYADGSVEQISADAFAALVLDAASTVVTIEAV